ncbi:MAG: hypothetical protein ACRC9P_01450 [Bacteroides sp.]
MAVAGQMVTDWDKYTRMHWGGEGADVDIHLEEYKGVIDGSFNYHSDFKANNWAEKIKLNNTNTYRWDRFGGAEAYGRSPGEELVSQRTINEKVTTVIERAMYSRHVFDEQDDWTSPNIMQRIGQEQGKALAREYDRAGITKLIHATEWKAPVDLKKSGAFHDGYNTALKGFTAETDMKAKAEMILEAHDQLILHAYRTDQDTDLSSFITLISPEWFNILLKHDKLMDLDFSGNNGDFAQRKIAVLNGIRIMETPRLDFRPVTDKNPYGKEFVRTADQAKTGLIMFNPAHTLLEIEAHGTQVRQFHEPKEWARYLDTFEMSKFEIRRGDSAFGLRADG